MDVNFNFGKMSEWGFIKEQVGEKNIVYFNKPRDIEHFVRSIVRSSSQISSERIDKACRNISEYVHPKYRLVDSLSRGIIYHHGAVPEPIRMYIEKLYAEIPEIKFVITSSTLLEGVNLPADRMFIMDNKKGRGNLNASDFKNLIGRVCRFSQIFSSVNGNLKKLEPLIYMVVGNYFSSNANVENYLSASMYVERKTTDDIQNVMLDKSEITKENEEKLDTAKEFIENYEGEIIEGYDLRKVKTNTGKVCFLNNISEFDIFDNENEMDNIVNKIKETGKLIDSTDILFKALNEIFFSRISKDNINRFQHEETRRFYKMFLDWRITNTSLNQMISSFMKYWKGIVKDDEKENLIFVGHWGDITREGHVPMWTDISMKSDVELINLAIVRIKEEQDFLDNVIIKYIEVLNDLEILKENLYLRIKYGTDDLRIITCIKNGISMSLAKILVEEYSDYIEIDLQNDILSFKDGIVFAMQEAHINEVLVCEMQYYL